MVLTPRDVGELPELESAVRNPQTAEYTLASRFRYVNRDDRGRSMTVRRTARLLALPFLLLAAVAVPAAGQPSGTAAAAAAAASAGADFDNDGFADLAAGARFRSVGGADGAGSVGVLYGSSDGLTTARGQLFTQVAGADEQSDQFGSALAAGDFNHDGFADLAAGASGENVNARAGAGAVSIVYGSASGLTTTGGQLFT